MNIAVRTMIHQDAPAVAVLENLLFDYPNGQNGLENYLLADHCSGLVATFQTSWQAERIAGFLLRENKASSIHVHRFGVHPDYQRKGVATMMLNASLDSMNYQRRRTFVEVQEENLAACLLLKSIGFSSKLVKGGFEDQDAIRFKMTLAVLA